MKEKNHFENGAYMLIFKRVLFSVKFIFKNDI